MPTPGTVTRMRRGFSDVLVLFAGLALPAGRRSAATLPSSFTPTCPTENPGRRVLRRRGICSGSVPSFDGSKLDVDLTQPIDGGAGTR